MSRLPRRIADSLYRLSVVKGSRGRQEHRLADMAIIPPEQRYQPPHPDRDAGCTEDTMDLALSEDMFAEPDNRLTVRYRLFRGKIVDFYIGQWTRTSAAPTEAWVEVARTDCHGGYVHWHLFNRDGATLVDHEEICPIPPNPVEGAACVDRMYQTELAKMQQNWENSLGRWGE